MYSGVTLSAHACKKVIPDVLETKMLTLTQIMIARTVVSENLQYLQYFICN